MTAWEKCHTYKQLVHLTTEVSDNKVCLPKTKVTYLNTVCVKKYRGVLTEKSLSTAIQRCSKVTYLNTASVHLYRGVLQKNTVCGHKYSLCKATQRCPTYTKGSHIYEQCQNKYG